MALSNLNKEVTTRLMEMIATDDNQLMTIKGDHAAYAKLSLLASQMKILEEQAKQIVVESQTNAELQTVDMKVKKVPGTIYYFYTQNSKKVLSLISPHEWDNYEVYHGSYIYDYDCMFKRIQ